MLKIKNIKFDTNLIRVKWENETGEFITHIYKHSDGKYGLDRDTAELGNEFYEELKKEAKKWLKRKKRR